MKKTILNILFLAILVLPAGAANPKALLIKGNKPHGELLSNVRSIKFSTGNLMLKTVTAETSFAINGIARINFGELPVCEIGTATYSTLEAALIAVKDGETIKLLADILFDAAAYDQGLGIGNNITFDLNGKTLDVVSDFEAAVWVTGSNASLNLLDPANGAFNAIGIGGGIATFLGAKATVTNAVATETDAAAYAGAGSQTTVTANVTSADCGVYANGGTVVVGGNVLITEVKGCGVFAIDGGTVTIGGAVTVPAGATYIKFGTTVKTPTDNTVPTTKAGYLTYTDGTSTVWVKDGGTGISTASISDTAAITGYCDLLGRKLQTEPTKGIYIILYDNGMVKKVVK